MPTNERTARKARIKRASAAARAELTRSEKDLRRRLRQVFERARDDLEQAIASRGDQSGVLRLAVLRDLKAQIEDRLGRLARSCDELLDEGLRSAVSIGVGPFNEALAGGALSRISEQALLGVRGFIEADGLQLSDRLWRIDQHARESVGRAVESAIIQGAGASEAAQEFLARALPVPTELTAKIGAAAAAKVARSAGAALMTDAAQRSAYSNALRVFRTEITRANGEAYRAAAFEVDDAAGTRFLLSPSHPERDVCDMHASVNRYGLGPGVYPKGKSPWPAHPNTLSFEEVVFADEVTDEDRAGAEDRISWIKRQPPEIQEAVLGSRMKRGALDQGKLTEGQIGTPWRVLKIRYAQQGFDIESMRPSPPAAEFAAKRGKQIDRAGAVDFVLERGTAAGVEYALAFDTRTGIEAFRKTSGQRSAVYFDEAEAELFRDPANRIELVHNHPSSSSLSVADFNLSSHPGIERVIAAGHDGGIYSGTAAIGGRELQRVADAVDQALYERMLTRLRAGDVSESQANLLHPHIKNTVMGKLEAVDYRVEKVGPGLESALATVGEWADELVEQLANEVRGRL